MAKSREDALANLVAASISIARRFQHHEFADQMIVELSHLERAVLRHIYRYPGISPTTLAADLSLQQSNASTALSDLVSRGFVLRESDPRDKRAVRLHVTETALDSVRRVRAEWASILEEIIDPATDPAAIAEALESLDHALVAHARRSNGHRGPEPRSFGS